MASIVDELEVLDDEQAVRSIVVNNMPEEALEEDIIIHFQKWRHGGGDIDHVRMREGGTVVLTFKNDEGLWIS